MRIKRIHSWEGLTIPEAKALQERLSEQVIVDGDPGDVRLIASGDLAFSKEGTAFAAVVLMTYPEMRVVEVHTGRERVRFPYVPGYLSFREAPLLLSLFERLSRTPDLVMIDGQGIAHPRGLGLAAHVGLFLGLPTIGVAKSRLVGDYDEPGPHKGDWSWLVFGGRKVGVVVRTKDGVRPVFVSPGNLIGFEACLRWTLATATRFRLPEPTRAAHNAVTQFKGEATRGELLF